MGIFQFKSRKTDKSKELSPEVQKFIAPFEEFLQNATYGKPADTHKAEDDSATENEIIFKESVQGETEMHESEVNHRKKSQKPILFYSVPASEALSPHFRETVMKSITGELEKSNEDGNQADTEI